MGQFASRAFDGDPYIDIMRALPDKELVWWVQKAIWLAEGFTILEHFGRVYPDIFMHKCGHCNGAGHVTCPHCNGYKIKRAHAQAFHLSEKTTVGRLLAASDLQECDHCGNYCPWDNESEWQEEWSKWERRLSYYDRTHGDLYNEWYEDVINEGRLDEDTQPEEEPMPDPSDQSVNAHISRQVSKDKRRLKALMRRVGGHPYEHSHMMPYGVRGTEPIDRCANQSGGQESNTQDWKLDEDNMQGKVIDPQRSLTENMENMGYQNFDLPPELHPEKFPELLLQGPGGPLQQFDRQIQAEYLLMGNLDAALRDAAKPAMFQPSAGTVACPICNGQAWYHEWLPNVRQLLKAEQPFWARTFSRMSPYWHQYSTNDGHPTYSPWMAALAAFQDTSKAHEAGAQPSVHARSSRLLGEIPSQPPLLTPGQVADAERTLQPGPLPEAPGPLVDFVGARRVDGGVDYGRLASSVGSSLPSAPTYIRDYGSRFMPSAQDIGGAAEDLFPAAGQQGSASRGPHDPLSTHAHEAMDPEELQNHALNTSCGPLLNRAVLDAQLAAAEVANPARRVARNLRDMRQPRKEAEVEEHKLLLK